MNLFFIHEDPVQIAEWSVDRHIVKMKTEALQCVIAVHHKLLGLNNTKEITPDYCERHFSTFPRKHEDGTPWPWALRFVKSGQGKWLLQSRANIVWILELVKSHLDEHKFRYPNVKPMECEVIYNWCMENFPYHLLPDIGLTVPYETMPPEYRTRKLSIDDYAKAWDDKEVSMEDSINAYRRLYKFGKVHLHKWSKRDEPSFFKTITL